MPGPPTPQPGVDVANLSLLAAANTSHVYVCLCAQCAPPSALAACVRVCAVCVQDGFVLDVLRSYTAVTPRLQLAARREGAAGVDQEAKAQEAGGAEGAEEAEGNAKGGAGEVEDGGGGGPGVAEEVLVEAASNSREVVERKVRVRVCASSAGCCGVLGRRRDPPTRSMVAPRAGVCMRCASVVPAAVAAIHVHQLTTTPRILISRNTLHTCANASAYPPV